MTVALVTILGVALAGLLGIVEVQLVRINDRLDRISDTVSRTDATLTGHILDHPAAGRRA